MESKYKVRLALAIGLMVAGLSSRAEGQTTPAVAIEIRLASETSLEQSGREQLERLLRSWDLSRWLFTRVVQIQSRVIPHSHPVLTVNTQYLSDDAAQLATLLHEQLHWFLVQRDAETPFGRS